MIQKKTFRYRKINDFFKFRYEVGLEDFDIDHQNCKVTFQATNQILKIAKLYGLERLYEKPDSNGLIA